MRAIALAAILCLVTSPATAQAGADSTSIRPSPARYVIDAAKLVREGGARSFSDLLVGQVPGLLVIPGWGLNGSGARIRFAGVRSFVNDAPLILVDGMRIDATENATLLQLDGPGPLRLEDISVEDVESIEVLRDPGSGVAYGPGASNGVILIRTKAGRSGPLRWETYGQAALEAASSNWPANYGGVDLDNANPSMRAGGCNLTAQAAGQCVQDFVQAFNPLVQRRPFETVLRRQVGFSGSGGPSWGAFRLAGGFDGDAGPYAMPGVSPAVDNLQRWNLRGTGSVQPFHGLDIGLGLVRVSSDLRLPTYNPIRAALLGPSDESQFVWDSVFHYPGGQRLDRTSWMIDARGTVLPGLTVRGALGRDAVDQRDGLVDPGQYRFDGLLQVVHNTAELNASVRGAISPSVRVDATIGYERLSRRSEENGAQGRDTTPFCVPPSPCAGWFSRVRRRSWSLYLTEEVVLRDRLSIAGTLRRDRFDEYRLSVVNPSIAVAWLARTGTTGLLNRLQLRAGYGSAGNVPPNTVPFFVGSPGVLGDPIRPDRTRSLEVGVDAGLLSAKWSAGLTFYDTRSNVGMQQTIVSSSGVFYRFVAGNKIGNRGVAASLTGRLVDRPSLAWDVRLSVWGNRNRIVELATPPFAIEWQYFIGGYPTGAYMAPRIRSFADVNGDGVIVPSEVIVDSLAGWAGTPHPTQGAALSSAFRLGRWRVSTLLEYRAGHALFNYLAASRCARITPTCRGRNDPTSSLQSQAIAVAAGWRTPVDYFEDADFLKLRDLSVSFDVPAAATSLVRARGATITLVGRNLATWTGYSGVDPEAGSYPLSFAGALPTVADVGTLPPLRSWTLRVQLAY